MRFQRGSKARPVRQHVLALFAFLSCSGCGSSEHTRHDYPFLVRVESDPGRPLPGVLLSRAGKPLGASDAAGTIRLNARGREGETLAFEIRCPAGHRQTNEPLSVVLRTRTEQSKIPEYLLRCPPLKRTLVVAVRAEHGPNLPVVYLGKELARTDRLGAAHVLLEAEPEDSLELTLDTSAQPELRPSNPSARFVIGGRDDVLSFTQTFQVTPKAPARRGRAPRGPIRIRMD